MSAAATILWFRQDLRLADNPALEAALHKGGPVVPVFIFSPEEEAPWQPGGASKWWLHHSLASLEKDLRAAGSRLILLRGKSTELLQKLLHETKADAVFWNRRYEPAIRKRDESIERMLLQEGVRVESFNSALLHEPWSIRNKTGGPFQVFTPFWRTCLSLPDPPEPAAAPTRIQVPKAWPDSLRLEELPLLPRANWTAGISETWKPGAAGAIERLQAFLASGWRDYDVERDLPAETGTSRLSPHLHFGEISPRQIWSALKRQRGDSQRELFEKPAPGHRTWRESRFATELGWREFSHHLLYHFPDMDQEPIRKEFRKFRWRKSSEFLKSWQKGKTGYPLVDAGMRELWHTGWMHNRVRMVAASFLVKHLLIPWQQGARWFWDTLVDADLAQNSMGWQWVAGCGADAAPFFRIFNPALQGAKFDASGAYVRRWVPELARLPDRWIHEPSKAPPHVLEGAGVKLGASYPEPIVSHGIARELALEAYNSL